jgi:hypothetical protein
LDSTMRSASSGLFASLFSEHGGQLRDNRNA